MDTAINKQEEQQYISTIKVEGLFGKFDHTIKLKEGGLTILYGENGVGKTTLFKLIYHGLRYCGDKGSDNSELENLKLIPFERMVISDQKNNTIYVIERPQNTNTREKYIKSKIREILPSESFKDLLTSQNHTSRRLYYHLIRNHLPDSLSKQYHETSDRENVSNQITGGRLTYKNFIKKYKHVINNITLKEVELYSYCYTDPYLIPSHRIQEKEEARIHKTARNFLKIVTKHEEEFEDRILKLTSSLNSRITNGEVSTEFEEKELKEKLKVLKKRVQELKEVGLLYQQETPITTLSDSLPEVAKVMVAINTNEYLEALEIFNEFYSKLFLFLDIINNRRFNYKKIAINKVEGLTVRDDEGNMFPLSNLSSGEQHELILIYELLFGHKSKQKKIFLIDEPEISLHVLWQMDFIKDMQEIIKLTGVQIIAATHSPAIINGNWDLTVQLKHPEQKSDTEGAEKEGGNE